MTDLSSLPETPHQAAKPRFADLARKLGIDPETLGQTPQAVDGPALGECGEPTETGPCEGTWRALEQDGAMWATECDRCHFQSSVKAASFDAKIGFQRRLQQAELPDAFVGAKFEEDEENKSALYLLRSWLADVEKGDPLPAPAIYGLPGRGKSHALTALCVRLVRDLERSVMFRTTRGLLRELQRFEHEAEREQAWRRARTVDVFAFDDLGAQQVTDWRQDQIAELVDERYVAGRPIVLATNYRPADWERVLDARTVSRLRGMTFAVELRGPDRRQQAIPEPFTEPVVQR